MRFDRVLLERIGRGTELIQRLVHKRTGAKSNKDGRDFEIAYLVHVIILELEQILNSYLETSHRDISEFSRFFFDEYPDAFVDDLHAKTMVGEFFEQLKRGSIDWPEVVRDFKIQRRMDRSHRFDATYRLVGGTMHELPNLRSLLNKHQLSNVDVKIFSFSKDFKKYISDNPDIMQALVTLTGSSAPDIQQVAYDAILSVFWRTESKRTFVDVMEVAADQSPYYFLSKWSDYGVFDDLQYKLEILLEDATVIFSGRFLHIEDLDGGMQTYLVPLEKDCIERFQAWVEITESMDYSSLEHQLWECRWNRVERSRKVYR